MRAEDVVHRPVGDLLEEILNRGAAAIPGYLSYLHGSPERYRIGVLLGLLGLGPEVVEVVRERLRRRDSPEKWALLQGLGELGHPEAEGYFARILRERASGDQTVDAIGALGRIAGERSLPALVECLEQPQLFPHACAALERYGTPAAVAALERKVMELPAFQALAGLGAASARDAFLVGLERDAEWAAESARGIGNLGDPELGSVLVPLLTAKKSPVRRAAFVAYAKLGAPRGVQPLLDVLAAGAEEWMVEALGSVDDPGAHRFLASLLDAGAPKRGWKRLFGGRSRGGSSPPRGAICRALRTASEAEVLARLGQELEEAPDTATLRLLLSNRALVDADGSGEALTRLWHADELLRMQVGAVALLQRPTADFLAEALRYLQRPGFLPQEAAPAGADAEHLLRGYASDNNPALLLGEFVDSGLLDLGHLYQALRSRVVTWTFPSEQEPQARFGQYQDMEVGGFLQAVAAAHPGSEEALTRIWDLLAQLEAHGDSLLDLFLCHGGHHRGGVQRCLCLGLPSAVAKFIEGKGDHDLPELDRIAEQLPSEGALVNPLRDLFARARQALKAECRDMALVSDSNIRGDMVLIEKV